MFKIVSDVSKEVSIIMTYPDRLTSEEKDAVEELRCRIKSSLTPNLLKDPSLFYRFLKARNFNVDKAEKMLLKHINWRKIHQADNILDMFHPREYFHKYVIPTVIGVDKAGDPILYAASGKSDPSDGLKCDTMNGISKSWIWFCEKNSDLLKKQTEKTGRECTQISFIIDLDKLPLSTVTNKTTSELWLLLINLFQDNYPERMKAAFVINAPSYYVIVFSLLKAVMSGEMFQKIKIFGRNGWKEALLSAVDADVLPAFLGGTRTDLDGNPLCLSFVGHGGRIPSQYYLGDEERFFKDKSQVQNVVVPPAEAREIGVDVEERGSRIQWEFLVKGKDIKFGLSAPSGKDNETEVVLPLEKYSTADGKEMNSYKSEAVGKHIIIFDNSYSWRSTKEIEYRVTVKRPE